MNIVGFIPGSGQQRRIPPPLPPDGGGFYYLKRVRDGAILLDKTGTYQRFDTELMGRAYADEFFYPEPVDVRWMPRLRTN